MWVYWFQVVLFFLLFFFLLLSNYFQSISIRLSMREFQWTCSDSSHCFALVDLFWHHHWLMCPAWNVCAIVFEKLACRNVICHHLWDESPHERNLEECTSLVFDPWHFSSQWICSSQCHVRFVNKRSFLLGRVYFIAVCFVLSGWFLFLEPSIPISTLATEGGWGLCFHPCLSVCLSVCLFVNRISQKVVDRLWQN